MDFYWLSNAVLVVHSKLLGSLKELAGLPALQGGEPGQVRKEAAITIYCKCRGQGSPPYSKLEWR
ncbi:hypothetical protein NTG1052_850004 [Candidatus Nitrotoga sp. 1052]|nr:hypothetical protein NTG1052_850004 [Candidatus Nitrotoga sp. 1052]